MIAKVSRDMKGDRGTMAQARKRSEKRITRTINISLDPIEYQAAQMLADEETAGVKAIFFGRLIDERMRSKIGRDWREQLEAEQSAAAAS
jgi:hypothetical protein